MRRGQAQPLRDVNWRGLAVLTVTSGMLNPRTGAAGVGATRDVPVPSDDQVVDNDGAMSSSPDAGSC